jgi:hypothetical protein
MTKQLTIALIISVLGNIFLIFNLSHHTSRFKDSRFNVRCLSTSYEIVPYTRTMTSSNGELDTTFTTDSDFYHFIYQQTGGDNGIRNVVDWMKFAAAKQYLFMIDNKICYGGPGLHKDTSYYEGVIFKFENIQIDSL